MLMIRYFDFAFYLLYLNILDKVKSLKLGDTFWYKIDKYERIIFSEGHQIRPFVFLKYDKGIIYCLLCSTTRLEGLQLINEKDKYSYVNDDILVKISIFGFIGLKNKLYINQIKRIAKKLYFNKKFCEIRDIFEEYIYLEVGDFVNYDDRKYIIYGMDSLNVTLYPILSSKPKFKVKIKGEGYVDILNIIVVKKEKISLLSDGDVKFVDMIKKVKRNYRKEISKYKRECFLKSKVEN